jgi:hypothetical protein
VPLLGNVGYKSRSLSAQATTAEAEILSASDAGRLALALYLLRSVLDELGHPQKHATVILEDNHATVLISQASAHPIPLLAKLVTSIFMNLLSLTGMIVVLLFWSLSSLLLPSKNASDMLTKQWCPKEGTASMPDIIMILATLGKSFYYRQSSTTVLPILLLLPHLLLPSNSTSMEALGGVRPRLYDVRLSSSVVRR